MISLRGTRLNSHMTREVTGVAEYCQVKKNLNNIH
jgi:hypothetical protein